MPNVLKRAGTWLGRCCRWRRGPMCCSGCGARLAWARRSAALRADAQKQQLVARVGISGTILLHRANQTAIVSAPLPPAPPDCFLCCCRAMLAKPRQPQLPSLTVSKSLSSLTVMPTGAQNPWVRGDAPAVKPTGSGRRYAGQLGGSPAALPCPAEPK